MIANRIARRCLVVGRVQGVFFRASTQQQARRLGICGYAKNLSDGRVEVLAIGTVENVTTLIAWLDHGPPTAHVERVEVIDVSTADIDEFAERFVTA